MPSISAIGIRNPACGALSSEDLYMMVVSPSKFAPSITIPSESLGIDTMPTLGSHRLQGSRGTGNFPKDSERGSDKLIRPDLTSEISSLQRSTGFSGFAGFLQLVVEMADPCTAGQYLPHPVVHLLETSEVFRTQPGANTGGTM
jgi:hypothetical protein